MLKITVIEISYHVWFSPSKNNISRRMLVEKGDTSSYFLFQDNLHCLVIII